jgi:hypothetical protein
MRGASIDMRIRLTRKGRGTGGISREGFLRYLENIVVAIQEGQLTNVRIIRKFGAMDERTLIELSNHIAFAESCPI